MQSITVDMPMGLPFISLEERFTRNWNIVLDVIIQKCSRLHTLTLLELPEETVELPISSLRLPSVLKPRSLRIRASPPEAYFRGPRYREWIFNAVVEAHVSSPDLERLEFAALALNHGIVDHWHAWPQFPHLKFLSLTGPRTSFYSPSNLFSQ